MFKKYLQYMDGSGRGFLLAILASILIALGGWQLYTTSELKAEIPKTYVTKSDVEKSHNKFLNQLDKMEDRQNKKFFDLSQKIDKIVDFLIKKNG